MTDSWHSTTSLTTEQRLDVLNLLNRTETVIGREAIDEGSRRIVVHGWKAEHWLLHRGGNLVGYALLAGTDHPTIEMCGGRFDQGLLHELLKIHPQVDWWKRNSLRVEHGTVIRTLEMLRTKLPVPVVDVPVGATLRAFEPRHDEDLWLEQNNAAFAHHPE